MLLRLQIFTPGTDIGTGPATVSVGCVGTCVVKHRHQELLNFLRTIDREVPEHLLT